MLSLLARGCMDWAAYRESPATETQKGLLLGPFFSLPDASNPGRSGISRVPVGALRDQKRASQSVAGSGSR